MQHLINHINGKFENCSTHPLEIAKQNHANGMYFPHMGAWCHRSCNKCAISPGRVKKTYFLGLIARIGRIEP